MSEPTAPEQAVDATAVENLMRVLMKGLRATQLYLPNNPIYQKAIDNVRAAFAPVWDECSEVELHVAETELRWEGSVVLSDETRGESLPWIMFKDGVRVLTLLPGVEETEIVKFLQVVHRARTLPADATDDLLTLLWEQDFDDIRYAAVELFAEGAAPLTPSEDGFGSPEAPSGEEVREQVAEEAKEAKQTPSGIVSMEDFDSTLYFLDDTELKYLQKEIDREYKQDLRSNVLSMLFDLLELQSFSTVRAELISIVEHFIPYLLGVGDFQSVAYVLSEIRVLLERARELLPEQRQQLEELPGRLSRPEAVGQLLQSLDEAIVHPSEDQLSRLFGELRGEAFESVLQWLPRLQTERVRQLLELTAQRLVETHPDLVVQLLESSEEPVLLETLTLVGRAKSPTFVPALGQLLASDSVAVRRSATEALAAVASPGAMKQLERAIDDSDREVRIAAVRVLAQRGHRGALEKVAQAVMGKTLRTADLTEKTVFFEAYGRLAGADGIELLKNMLLGRGLLRRREDPETRACAAMALGKIGGEAVKETLVQADGEKDPLVRNAINRALREVK